MDSLVELLPKEAAMLREISQSQWLAMDWEINLTASAVALEYAATRITELERQLEGAREDERRAIADWCLREMYEPFVPLERAKALKSIADYLTNMDTPND